MRHHMRNSPISPSLQDEVLAARLAIAKATLAKLQARLPEPAPPQYTPYEELRPPTHEEQERFKKRMIKLMNDIMRDAETEKREWYLSLTAYAP